MVTWLKNYADDAVRSRQVPRRLHPLRRREILWTLVILLIVTLTRLVISSPPFGVARWYVSQLGTGAQILVGRQDLSGDIAGNFAQARALIDPSFQAYDRLVEIFPLVGISWDVQHGHPRLPMEIPLFVPLVMVDSSSPIFQLIALVLPVVAALALAWSLRLMDVPAFAAWAVTAIFLVTPIGGFALESSYPFVALALAAGWRFRDRPLIAAAGLAVAGAGRGLALLPAAYFFVARSWRTLIWLIGILASLLVVAVVIEPTVIGDFFDRGLEWGRVNADRPDNASLSAALIRPIYAYTIAFVIFLLAARKAALLYWALAWLSAALAPIAWTYAAVAMFPLGAVIWSKGRWAQVLVLVSALAVIANGSYAGLSYAVVVLLLGLGLVISTFSSSQATYQKDDSLTK